MTFTIDQSVRSPNHSARLKGVRPSAIVLHTTEGKFPSDLWWLCNPQKDGKYQPVSCHYVISPKGAIHQIVADDRRAWHAGTGSYLGITDWNNVSLGIEVSHKQGQPWPEVQRDALEWLCKQLIDKYAIRQSMVVAHRWIAPDRKVDPTDWPDVELAAWIASLYNVDWPALWYWPNYHEVSSFGIVQKWRDEHTAGRPLGKPLYATERTRIDGRVDMTFEDGYVTYREGEGAIVYRKQV